MMVSSVGTKLKKMTAFPQTQSTVIGIHAWYCIPGPQLASEEVLSSLGEFNVLFG